MSARDDALRNFVHAAVTMNAIRICEWFYEYAHFLAVRHCSAKTKLRRSCCFA